MGEGAARLMVNSFLYFLYTSDADDNVRLERLIKEGKTPLQAIEILAREIDDKKRRIDMKKTMIFLLTLFVYTGASYAAPVVAPQASHGLAWDLWRCAFPT